MPRHAKCFAAIAALPLLLALAGPALAHAELKRVEPVPGSTVTSPRDVTVSLSEKLEPAFSSITVRNGAGERVDAGPTQVSGNMMRVRLKPIGKGTYRVNWRALSVDTHRTEGSFSFHVRE